MKSFLKSNHKKYPCQKAFVLFVNRLTATANGTPLSWQCPRTTPSCPLTMRRPRQRESSTSPLDHTTWSEVASMERKDSSAACDTSPSTATTNCLAIGRLRSFRLLRILPLNPVLCLTVALPILVSMVESANKPLKSSIVNVKILGKFFKLPRQDLKFKEWLHAQLC